VKVGIGQTSVSPLGHAQDPGGTLSLVGPELGAASGPALSGGEVEDTGAVAGVHRLQQGAGTGQLNVVAVSGDG
jgi:hypothetical protein